MEAQYGFTKEILVMEALESPLSDSVSSEHSPEMPGNQDPKDTGSNRAPTKPDTSYQGAFLSKSDSQWVKLFMEDYCDSPKLFKISQQVLLYIIDTLHCGPGEWRVDWHDLLAELQSMNAAIKDYPTCFLDQSQPEGDVDSHGAFDVTDPSAKHLGHAQLRAVGNAARKQSGETNGDVHMNIQVDKTRGIGAKKNQKQSIQQALGVGLTSVAEAENAVCILKRYGEGGSRPVQAVMDQIS
ncbi:hypothetical protein DFH09DRAFT_1093413 [Mycena vulgaris]|nr:hypothetical protein DFH09DRAFT_1093413 [Mycena vulgaris]